MRSGCYGKHRVVRKWKPKRSICSWFIFGEEKKVFSRVTNLESYDWTDIELIILKVDISDWRYTEYGMCLLSLFRAIWFSMKINRLLQKHMGSELLFVDQQGVNWFSPTCRNCFVDRNRWASSNCFHYFFLHVATKPFGRTHKNHAVHFFHLPPGVVQSLIIWGEFSKGLGLMVLAKEPCKAPIHLLKERSKHNTFIRPLQLLKSNMEAGIWWFQNKPSLFPGIQPYSITMFNLHV